jgi:hypothetical protein
MDPARTRKEVLPVTEELVRLLAERIPERTPEMGWTDREIWQYRGMRDVVLLLQRELKEIKDVQHT